MPVAVGGAPRARRTGLFHRESTRLRSNVADQVQRDLLPAGRMLSVFLVLCELLAEIAVLIWSRGDPCDRPLRFWVCVLIMLQAGTVLLNCLNIWYGRDSLGQHRNGLSASDLDMYTDVGAAVSRRRSSGEAVSDSGVAGSSRGDDGGAMIVVDFAHGSSSGDDNTLDQMHQSDTQPLIDSSASALLADSDPTFSSSLESSSSSSEPPSSSLLAHADSRPAASARTTARSRQSSPARVLAAITGGASSSGGGVSITITGGSSGAAVISTEFVDRYVRIVNAWYLIWFILGSFWVSDGGTCSATAPHLYRLIVALTIIYYALLFLPLACFCLIVCCLPLFILVYRIMLPYAERDRRRPRAADPAQVQNLNSIVYSAATFANHAGNESLEDASCVICLCEYEEDEIVRFLPCKHHFHKDCVDVWLRLDKACCLCKQDIDAQSPALTSPV